MANKTLTTIDVLVNYITNSSDYNKALKKSQEDLQKVANDNVIKLDIGINSKKAKNELDGIVKMISSTFKDIPLDKIIKPFITSIFDENATTESIENIVNTTYSKLSTLKNNLTKEELVLLPSLNNKQLNKVISDIEKINLETVKLSENISNAKKSFNSIKSISSSKAINQFWVTDKHDMDDSNKRAAEWVQSVVKQGVAVDGVIKKYAELSVVYDNIDDEMSSIYEKDNKDIEDIKKLISLKQTSLALEEAINKIEREKGLEVSEFDKSDIGELRHQYEQLVVEEAKSKSNLTKMQGDLLKYISNAAVANTELRSSEVIAAANKINSTFKELENSSNQTFSSISDNIDESGKSLSKYAVNLEEALSKVRELYNKKEKEALSKEEKTDYIGYIQRVKNLDKDQLPVMPGKDFDFINRKGEYNDVINEVNAIGKEMVSVGNTTETVIQNNGEDVEKLKDKIVELTNEIEELKEKASKNILDPTEQERSLTLIEALRNELASAQNSLYNSVSFDSYYEIESALEEINEKYKSINEELEEYKAKQESVQNDVGSEELKDTVKEIMSDLGYAWQASVDQFIERINDISKMDFENIMSPLKESMLNIVDEFKIALNNVEFPEEQFDKISGLFEKWNQILKESENNKITDSNKNGLSSGWTKQDNGKFIDNLTGEIHVFDKTTTAIIEEQKAIGELQIAFRGLTDSMDGFMSTTDRQMTFFTTSPYLAREYADELGGVYQANVALGKSLYINGQGRDWNAIEYLGDGSDEASKKIIALRQQIENLQNTLNSTQAINTGLDGRIEVNRGDYSYMVQMYGAMGAEYESYIEAVEKGNLIELQEDETIQKLMIDLYEAEKAYKAISDSKDNVYGTHTTNDFGELAKNLGYSSVVFENIKDSFDYLSRLTTVGIIFDESQVSNVKIVNEQLDQLINKLDRISGTGYNLPKYQPNKSDILSTDISDEFKKESKIVKETIEAEENNLYDLSDYIRSYVIPAIKEKTHEFEKEQNTVSDSVKFEVDELQKLAQKLIEISGFIHDLSEHPISISIEGFESGEFDKLKSSIDSLDIEKLNSLSSLLKELSKTNKSASNIIDIAIALDELQKVISSDSPNEFLTQIKELLSYSKELENLAKILSESEKKISKAGKKVKKDNSSEDQLKYYRKQDIEYQKERDKSLAKGKQQLKEYYDSLLNVEKLEKKVNSYDVQGYSTEYYDKLNGIRDAIEKIKSINDKGLDNITAEDLKDAEEYRNYIDSTLKLLKSNKGNYKLADELNKSKQISKMVEWLVKYQGASKETREEVQKLIDQLNQLDDGDNRGLKEISKAFIDLTSDAKAAGDEVKSMGQKIREQISHKFAEQFARYFSIQDIIRYIRTISSTVTELDSAITELRKVSDATEDRLSLSFEKSAKTAKELGASITDVINATSDWSRLGYSVDEAEELARVSTLFQNVGDNMDAESANSYLISTLQGFQLTANKSEEIIDKFNEVANNYAIDTAGIGEALQRSAAAFNAANTDLSKSIAVVTAANTIAQNPEKVGTAFVTLSARIRGAKQEIVDLGEETDEYVESTSKLRDQVKAATGVDIMLNENTYKDIYTILVEIGKVWDQINDIDQAALLEALAGKRQSNIVAGLLDNAELLEKIYNTAENDSYKSAAREQENYAKSIQYSMDKVKASAQELAHTFLNSDVIKSLMESFNTFLQNLNRDISMGSPFIKALEFILTATAKLVENISKIPGAIEIIIALLAKSALSGTKNIFDGISSLGSKGNKKGLLSSIFGINKSDIGFLETFITKYKELTAVKIANTGATSVEKLAEDSLNKERVEGTIVTGTETAEEVGNTTAKVANTGATISLTAATKALGVAIKSNPIGLIATVAAVAIVGLTKLADELIVTSEEIQEASETAKNAIDEVYSDIKSKTSTVKELGEQYAKLAQGVKDLGTINQSQGSLSTDEYEEFLDLSNQLVNVFPQLIKGYDDNGNAILDLSGDFDTITGSLQGLLKVEQDLANQKIIENLPNVYAGYTDNIKNYERELESLEAREKALLALRNSDYEDVSKEYGQNTFRFNWGKISEQETIEIESELMRAFEEAGMSIVNSIGTISDLDGNKILDITIDSNEDLEKFQNLSEVIGNTYGNILNQIQIQESKIKGENASFSKYLNTWLEGQWLYSSSDPLMQKVMKGIVLDDDFMNILKESGIDTQNWDSLSRALEEQLIAAIDDVDDAKIKGYMSQLLSGENFDNIDVAYSEIIKYLIGLPGFDENSPIVLYYETQQTEYNNKKEGLVKHLTNGITDIREGQKLAQQIRDNFDTLTNNQVNKLMNLSIPNGVIYSWEELLDLIKEVNSKTSKFDISQFSSDTETFESLQSLYNSFRENIENGTLKNPLDIGDIQGLDDTFKVLDSFEDFQNIALNSASSINEVQDAFDKLATEYTNAKYQVVTIDNSNKELIASQMELDGITRESADTFVDYYSNLNSLKTMGDINISLKLKDTIKSQMEELNNDGGVDLTLRPVINSSELKAKGWDAGDGIATLFSSTFSNEDNTIAMNFTPIMTDGNGHKIGILTEEELQRYAEKVLAGGEDYYNLKIGATFEGEDAIEQAVEQAEYIHELQDQFYSDNGELNYAIFGNEKALTEYAGILGVTTESLAQYIFEETMADGLTLDTSAQIQSLLELANQANLTGECYEYLIELEEIYAGLESGVYGQGTEDRAKALTRASELKKLIENAVNDGKLEFEAPKIDFNPTVKSAGGAGKDAGDAYVDAYEKELEKLEADRDQGLITERQFLDKWKDLIDKFFKGVDGYTDKYKSEMSSWQNSMLSYMNSVGNAVISLIDRRIQETEKARDAAIKALEDEKQAALDAIDAQIDEIDDLIDAKNDEIDQLQDEIDAIQKAADERQRNLDLMQAEYDLQRALSQRTKLVKIYARNYGNIV